MHAVLAANTLHLHVLITKLQDTAKKTKWVVELIEGVLAAQDAVMESAQAVHVSDMVCHYT